MRVEAAYRMAANHHNPLEAPSTVAVWEGGRLTLYESTQGIRATQQTVAQLLGLPIAHVRVITQFVGGGFGSKAMVWPNVTLTAMAARHVRRPVKLMLTRPQMFTSNGHREEQEQRITLGADAGRAADRDPAREALDHLAVRRLGRACDRRLLAAVRLRRTTSACTGSSRATR